MTTDFREECPSCGFMFESAPPAAAAEMPLAGWTFQRDGDLITINSPTGSGVVVLKDDEAPRVIPGEVLFELAEAILAAKMAPAAAEIPEPLESNEWVTQARLTLDRLAGFLQRINAPHAIDWREWIANAEAMVLALQANATQAQPATHAEVLTDAEIIVRAPSSMKNATDTLTFARWVEERTRAALATQAAQTQQPKDVGVSLRAGLSGRKLPAIPDAGVPTSEASRDL